MPSQNTKLKQRTNPYPLSGGWEYVTYLWFRSSKISIIDYRPTLLRLIPIPKNRGMKSDDQFNIAVESAEKTMTRRASSTRLFFFHFLHAYFDIDPPPWKGRENTELEHENESFKQRRFLFIFPLFYIASRHTSLKRCVDTKYFFFLFSVSYTGWALLARPLNEIFFQHRKAIYVS